MTLAAAYVEPGATDTFALVADPGYLWLTNGPALIVDGAPTDKGPLVRPFLSGPEVLSIKVHRIHR